MLQEGWATVVRVYSCVVRVYIIHTYYTPIHTSTRLWRACSARKKRALNACDEYVKRGVFTLQINPGKTRTSQQSSRAQKREHDRMGDEFLTDSRVNCELVIQHTLL